MGTLAKATRPLVAFLASAALTLPAPLQGQAPLRPADAIAPVLTELGRLRAVEDSSFTIRSLLITRDVANISLGAGRIWPLTNVNGRVVGALYQGKGSLKFTAPNPVERERMGEYLGVDSLDATFSRLVLFFTDGTLDALYRIGVSPEQAGVPGPLSELLGRATDYLKTYKDRTWDPSFLEPVLNGRENGMFFALVDRDRGEEVIVRIDPDDPEPVSLSVKSKAPGSDIDPEVVTQFAWNDRPLPPRESMRRQVSVSKYVIDVQMPQQVDGGVAFRAKAECQLVIPPGGYGPWIPFYLFPELDVDSATWDGAPVAIYKNDDAYYTWVRAPARLEAGAAPVLTVYYHGDLLARYGDWFILKSSIGWYPGAVDGRAKATFDITYHTPIGYPIASVGNMVDSSTTGRMVTTRWVHEGPMRNASFNIGRFKSYELRAEGAPPITLLWSDAGHREFAREVGVAPLAHVREVISDEAASSFKFFSNVYGPPVEPRFFATEIMGFHGEAFPGLVHYSFMTFLPEDVTQMSPGFNQMFRAHEVAHQWWGISVDYASYRDRWLSEGLADFSGLWYMQTRLGSLEKYLGMLREYRGNILPVRDHLGATSLGHRTGTDRFPKYYSYAVYMKGAWTAHMLRVLMLQMSTMSEDRFKAAMQEFYTTYRGRYASTDDFRVVMEKHAGTDLKWFFDEWIDGTSVPTYRWAWQSEAVEDGKQKVRIRVRQSEVPESFQMWVPVAAELEDGRVLRTRIHVTGGESIAELPLLPAKVKTVRFNEFEGVLADVRSENWSALP